MYGDSTRKKLLASNRQFIAGEKMNVKIDMLLQSPNWIMLFYR